MLAFLSQYWWAFFALAAVLYLYAILNQVQRMKNISSSFSKAFQSDYHGFKPVQEAQSAFGRGLVPMFLAAGVASISAIFGLIGLIVALINYSKH